MLTKNIFLHNFLYFAKFTWSENIVNFLHRKFNISHKPCKSFKNISLKGSPTLMTISLLAMPLVSTKRFRWPCHDDINIPIFRRLSNGGITVKTDRKFIWYILCHISFISPSKWVTSFLVTILYRVLFLVQLVCGLFKNVRLITSIMQV